jgi:RNA polymerase sigma-70 factor, ECF subfamily
MQSPDAHSSLDLLMQARSGDDGALDELLSRYLPRLRRWASGRLPASARTLLDTSDVVQDAVISALKHIDTLEIRDEGSLQAYLRRAVNNRIIDLYRRAQRRPARAELQEDTPAVDASPVEAAIGAEALARYEEALSKLRDEERQAILLRVELQNSYEEIATALNKPTAAAARMSVTRALARLAQEMNRAR